MPNFDIRITSGSTRTVWEDPATAEKPSRLNFDPARPHTYQEVELGTQVFVQATVDGVDGPLDVDLGGELFSHSFAEVPVWPHPPVIPSAGQTSRARFTPTDVGFHNFVMRRTNGGAIFVPFWVVAP